MSRYGAQHPIVVHSNSPTPASYVVVGHCCESGDLFTCAPGDPEVIQERLLNTAAIGDLVSIEAAGAYCSSMSTKNYNSFPEAPEVLLEESGELKLIRRYELFRLVVGVHGTFLTCFNYFVLNCRRQTLEQILENEVAV